MDFVVLMMQPLIITNKAKLCAVLLLEEAETNAVPVVPQQFPVSDFISRSVNTTTVVCLSLCACHDDMRGEERRYSINHFYLGMRRRWVVTLKSQPI
jgi:hypothetical protein